MKCERCGKNIGLFNPGVKTSDGLGVCNKCVDELGYDKDVVKYRTWDSIRNGKAAEDQAKAAALKQQEEQTFPIVGVVYKNDAGKEIQKILKSELSKASDEKYQGMTNKDIKEDCSYDERIYEYEDIDLYGLFEFTDYEGSPAIKVCIDELSGPVHIGWIPKEKVSRVMELIDGRSYAVQIHIYGGKYKYLDMDENDKDVVLTDETDYKATAMVVFD